MKELVSLLILQKKQLKSNLLSKMLDLPQDSCWVKLFSSSTLIWKRHASRHIGIILARLFKGYVFTKVNFKSDDSTVFKLVMVWTRFLRLGVQDIWGVEFISFSFWYIAEPGLGKIQSWVFLDLCQFKIQIDSGHILCSKFRFLELEGFK